MAKTVKQGCRRVVSTLRADGHLGADMNMDKGQWGMFSIVSMVIIVSIFSRTRGIYG